MIRAAKIDPAETTMSTPQLTSGENTDVPDMAALNRSTRFVSGEAVDKIIGVVILPIGIYFLYLAFP